MVYEMGEYYLMSSNQVPLKKTHPNKMASFFASVPTMKDTLLALWKKETRL